MSNRHRKDLGRSNPQRFVKLDHWFMKSAAWKDLRAPARCIYLEIAMRYNGSNNGFIVYSVRQAADELKIGKSTAARAFDELQAHGFIVPERRGHFHWKINPNGSKNRPASEWRLTAFENDRTTMPVEKLPTKEFARWPEIQNSVPPQVRMVPVVKPYGPSTGTTPTKTNAGGTCSGTMKGVRTG